MRSGRGLPALKPFREGKTQTPSMGGWFFIPQTRQVSALPVCPQKPETSDNWMLQSCSGSYFRAVGKSFLKEMWTCRALCEKGLSAPQKHTTVVTASEKTRKPWEKKNLKELFESKGIFSKKTPAPKKLFTRYPRGFDSPQTLKPKNLGSTFQMRQTNEVHNFH